ncbi:serine/threonine-protein phosphatase 6 regulatory subunit 2-like [Seriola lalandi dorsalis]|uniref:serine/threonine-protein phosphatase 6 regulatory subunit 2-like n=1 Tax=Seriola lalandi dorsalis TaxID=1841481 RepID=UPI000C6FB4E3|nr:serine/threonine-protein phosphatase 6 regulatory subunit 2-like [Seriola lalandi dorsalis]
MENGGREQDRGSESDEDEDSEQNASDTSPGWTANFRDSGGTAASQNQAGWDSSAGGGAETQETGWANFTEFQPFSGTETNPRCSSPVDGGAADKQAKQNHEKSADAGASPGTWPVGEGRKAPLVASDSSSSGGSDSEEDDKNAGASPTAAITSEKAGAPGNKTADLKRLGSYN